MVTIVSAVCSQPCSAGRRSPVDVTEDQRDLVAATSSYDQQPADELVQTARDLGQQLEYHAIIRGDDNCFYHAILDQVRNRPEVSRLIPHGVTESWALADHSSQRQAESDLCTVQRTVDADTGLLA